MDFIEKLDFLMERYGLNKRSLSKKSEIPYTTIDNWYKRGYENLTLPTLRKLAQYFNTTLDYWFIDEITDPNYGKTSGFKVEYDEMEHIKKYRFISTHSPDGASVVDTVLDREYAMAGRLKELEERIQKAEPAVIDFHSTTNSHLVSYYHSASAGSGVFILGNEGSEQIAIPDTPENKMVDYAIGVSGHSMEPDYHDGDIVLVSQRVEMHPGDVGIFIINNDAYIKEYGETELISRNPAVPNIKIAEYDNIVCMGKVIGKL